MSAPNGFRFTSSIKKVALLINRKQGENYHMRPVKTRHTGFSFIVTTAVRPREVYISRGLPSEAPRHNFERETNWQIMIRSSCHPSVVIVRGEGEKDVSRVCAVRTEAQLASVCV